MVVLTAEGVGFKLIINWNITKLGRFSTFFILMQISSHKRLLYFQFISPGLSQLEERFNKKKDCVAHNLNISKLLW